MLIKFIFLCWCLVMQALLLQGQQTMSATNAAKPQPPQRLSTEEPSNTTILNVKTVATTATASTPKIIENDKEHKIHDSESSDVAYDYGIGTMPDYDIATIKYGDDNGTDDDAERHGATFVALMVG